MSAEPISASDDGDLLSLPITPDLLDALRDRDAVEVEAFREASWWIAQPPPAWTWRRILDPLALILGVTLLVSGVLYLVAFNWSELGRLSKVAVGLAPVLAIGIAATIAGTERLTGRVLAAAGMPLSLGMLLSIGLAYPTGGASWPLFALWAALCVPWALTSRLAASWIGVTLAADVALVSAALAWAPMEGLALDGLLLGLIGIHALAWGSLAGAAWMRVPGAFVWVRESVLAPALLLLAYWPIEAILMTDDWTRSWLDPLGIIAFVAVGVVIQVGFALGRIRAFPAAVQLLSLLAVVTTALGRVAIELLDDVELAGLFLTVPLGFAILLQLTLSSLWLVWGWRRGRPTTPADIPGSGTHVTSRPESPRPQIWWPRLGALLSHLDAQDLLSDDEAEPRLLAGVRARPDRSPWYLRGALFGGGLLAGGVLACTCGPLGALSSGIAFLLPGVLLAMAAIAGRWGRPERWADWTDPLLFALMIAAQLLVTVGLFMSIDAIPLLEDHTLGLGSATVALIQLGLLVLFPDRWHRTLSTVALCVCLAAISSDLSLWQVRDVGTVLAVLAGAVLLASRPALSGTPLRELLMSVALGFVLYGLAGMGRFWTGWADEGWILIVGLAAGALSIAIVAWTLSRVRAPAHGWLVSLLGCVLIVALGSSMPALPVALCFILLGVLTKDVPVIVVSILALVGFGSWAYVAFDWPILLKAGALLGSGGVLLGLRGYLRAVVPERPLLLEEAA